MFFEPTYEIIVDRDEFLNFIDWLPQTKETERYYISLFARKKYLSPTDDIKLKADKGQLKRIVAKKEWIYDKVDKLEVKTDSYKIDDLIIPNHALVTYITPNPRNMHKAAGQLAKDIVDKVISGRLIDNPHSLALNHIQTSSTNRPFFDLDIDFHDKGNVLQPKKMLHLLCCFMNLSAITLIRTRGGYHALIETKEIDKEYAKTWYQNISKYQSDTFEITMNGDNMIPIPGCCQGTFVPKMVVQSGKLLK